MYYYYFNLQLSFANFSHGEVINQVSKAKKAYK